MSASDFLHAFNQIDRVLRDLVGVGRDQGFRTVLRAGAERSSNVRAYERELIKFAELRNVIVHEQVKPDYVIAEPHPEIVDRIVGIAAKLMDPPKALALAVTEVKTLDVAEPIAAALRWSQEFQISQFPIYSDRQFQGLLGSRCIAQWLADSVASAGILFDEVSVGAVLKHDETRGRNVAFLARDASVHDAIELFAQPPHPDRPVLEAILITATGRREEKLLGIITPWDMLKYSDQPRKYPAPG